MRPRSPARATPAWADDDVEGDWTTGRVPGNALAMSESPYAIPVEDLVDSARVPLTEQVQEHPERRFFGGEPGAPLPWADGMSGDADGE